MTPMLAPLMKNEVATNPAYRKVVAALDDCEKRYDGLIKRTGATNDLRLASTVAILKGEVEQRRRLEVELLTAGGNEKPRDWAEWEKGVVGERGEVRGWR